MMVELSRQYAATAATAATAEEAHAAAASARKIAEDMKTLAAQWAGTQSDCERNSYQAAKESAYWAAEAAKSAAKWLAV